MNEMNKIPKYIKSAFLDDLRSKLDYPFDDTDLKDIEEFITIYENINKKLNEQLQQRDEVIEKAIKELSFIDDALEKDILNVPLCITKINKAIEILNKYKNKEND